MRVTIPLLVVTLWSATPALAQQAGEGAAVSLARPGELTQVGQSPRVLASERTHETGWFALGVPIAGGALISYGLAIGYALADSCDPVSSWLCLGPFFRDMGLVIGSVAIGIAAVLLVIGGVRWREVDVDNGNRARALELALDSRGVGVRW